MLYVKWKCSQVKCYDSMCRCKCVSNNIHAKCSLDCATEHHRWCHSQVKLDDKYFSSYVTQDNNESSSTVNDTNVQCCNEPVQEVMPFVLVKLWTISRTMYSCAHACLVTYSFTISYHTNSFWACICQLMKSNVWQPSCYVSLLEG